MWTKLIDKDGNLSILDVAEFDFSQEDRIICYTKAGRRHDIIAPKAGIEFFKEAVNTTLQRLANGVLGGWVYYDSTSKGAKKYHDKA
jgi:hypothetical protein